MTDSGEMTINLTVCNSIQWLAFTGCQLASASVARCMTTVASSIYSTSQTVDIDAASEGLMCHA